MTECLVIGFGVLDFDTSDWMNHRSPANADAGKSLSLQEIVTKHNLVYVFLGLGGKAVKARLD